DRSPAGCYRHSRGAEKQEQNEDRTNDFPSHVDVLLLVVTWLGERGSAISESGENDRTIFAAHQDCRSAIRLRSIDCSTSASTSARLTEVRAKGATSSALVLQTLGTISARHAW